MIYEVMSGPASVTGNHLTLEGVAGIVTVKATQPGDTTWAPALEVINTFEVVDSYAYWADLTFRRPTEATTVYMNELKEVMLVATATVDHPEVLSVNWVLFEINGQQMDDVVNWGAGNYTATCSPPDVGTYTLNVSAEITGGNITTHSSTFVVTADVAKVTHPAFEGVWISPQENTAVGSFVFPTYVGTFTPITLHLSMSCPDPGCEPWDRIGYMEAKDPTGKWVEILRYITPYGVPCDHQIDITDYASIFQGVVDLRFKIETHENRLIADVNVVFTKGARLKIINTVHNWGDLNTGNAAGFYNATHFIQVNGANAFTQNLWVGNPNTDDCMPQNGTWYYNRSGWCPGSISFVYDYAFTPYLNTPDVVIGDQFEIDAEDRVISFKGYDCGLYFVMIISDQGIEVKKLVVQ